jgi:hypothetical protein
MKITTATRKGRRPDGLRKVNTAIQYTTPCFLASAAWQHAQFANLAVSHSQAGHQMDALVYDTYAEITQHVETEIRQGAPGPVVVIKTWDTNVR